jgi:pilin isopeptide linkage protein/LPXTG-motif cell wall-anchored protein
MKRLKKLWSLSAIIGMMISLFPMSAIAETADQTGVVVNQVTVTDTNDQEITENHRIDQKTAVKLNLSWALAQPTLIEENTTTIIELPANLHYPEQSGSLGEMGNYQVKNQQLIFQFKQNYQKTADGLVPDFASAKFYEGLIEVTAETTSENVEAETIDFGNNVLTSIYYNKASDPAADIVNQVEADQTIAKRQARADHEANLNARGVNLFTNIKITDFNDQEFNEENPAVQDANIKIHFDWVLDDAEIIQNGDFYTYQLPDYFSIHNTVTDVLKNQDGDVLGSFTLDLNGLLTVTFNDKAGNLSERQGTIDLRTELKITTENETIEISTGITDEAGVEIRIVIPVVKADISKSGKIEADNSVTWTIILNEERRDLRNAVLRDTMPEGLSVWYTQDYVMNENGEWVIPPAGFINSWIAGTDYVYKFTSGVMNQPVKIVLKMRVADESKKEFLNKATISGDNFISNSAEASVSFDDRDNYKYCTDYDLNTGIFNWEIKATYTTDGGILKDWMYSRYGDPNTAKHYLLKDSIKVYDENGNEVASDKWTFSEATADYKEKNGEYVHFTLNFAEKGVYKVKYSTQTFDVPTPLRSALQNTALIIDGTESEEINAGETPDVEGALGITKTAPSKNYATNTISWQVVLNKNRLLMKDAIIKDRYTTLSGINKSALQLIESSLVVKANDGTTDKVLTKDSDYVLEKVDGDEDYSLGFNIRLIGAYATTSDQITFNYDTHFFMDKQPHHDTGTTQRFDNSVVVTYTGEDGKNHTDGAELATWVSAQYAFNGLKYGKYLTEGADVAKAFSHNNPFLETTAGENSVYWTALFNTWKTTIPKETTIKEALGEGQTLKELVIYDVDVAASKLEAAQLGTKWEVNVDYTYELDEAGVPTITLLKDKESTFAIFVSAEAADEVPTYKNVATMTVKDSKPIKVEGTVEKSAKDAWISKSGQQGTGEDYRSINWSVVLNKDGHTIHDPVVKDTVKINEQTFVYDADKNVVVKVFKAKNNGSGTFVKDGEALVFTEENSPVVTSDSAAGTQTLTIHLGETIDSAYIIEYQTLLDPGIQNNEVIANEASLYGKDIQFHEVTKTVTVKSTDGEGTSSGKNGSITFRKLDENDQLITTSSAFFDLYRKDTEGNLTLMLSNIEVKGDKIIENGAEVDHLSNLRYGTYVIVESQAPEGYVKDNQEHEFIISRERINHTFSLENRKASSKIELTAKKELSGRPLKAEEFSFNLKGEGVDQIQKNAADGTITFDAIEYGEAGTYEYTISEVIPAEKEADITYDETTYKVIVTVEEKAGELEATAEYENVEVGEVPTFKNTYAVTPGSIRLEAQKELTGRKLKAEEFSFNLKGEGVDQIQKNAADGTITFDAIEYGEAGTYEYTISEVIPAEKEAGITYDDTIYKVFVTVEEKAGKLETTAVYEGVEAGKQPIFTNHFTPDKEIPPGELLLKKTDSKTGKRLANAEFKLVTGEDKVVEGQEMIVTGKDGTILIKGLTDGSYKLIETKAPKGYQLDATPIEFSVKDNQPNIKEVTKENTPIAEPEIEKTKDETKNSVTKKNTTTHQTTTRSTSTTSKRLPSTGSQNSGIWSTLGILVLLIVLGVVVLKVRKKSI